MELMKHLSTETRAAPSFDTSRKPSATSDYRFQTSPLLIKRPVFIAIEITLAWLTVSLALGLLLAWLFTDEWQKTALPKTQEPIYAVITPVALDACEDAVRNILREEKIHFATASAIISATGRQTLDQVITEISKCKNAVLTIEGHTDNTGSVSFNKKLSLERANTVAKALQAADLEGFTFITRGLGSEESIASNETSEGRYENRRIEFYLRKGGEHE